MPEPLKNLYTVELIESLSQQIKAQYGDFNATGFISHILDEEWEGKELKERMKHISEALHLFLPMPYSEAIQILINAAPAFNGFQYMFFPGFVERYGLDEYETSIRALEAFTQYSSSEFAVRPFIKKYAHVMMAQMALWARSENHHLRRLASEGCRPRLPWAMTLPEFKKDPAPILPILERLKDDESEYVRRSVANNLNDISKDNPQIVTEIAKQWLGQDQQTDRIIKHACRTLLKQGNAEMMELFGFTKPDKVRIKELTAQPAIEIGGSLNFSFLLETDTNQLGKLRIEYAIGFVKKHGSISQKVFKISESHIQSKNKRVTRSHSFRKISTRKYYAGDHEVSIIVNGQIMASIPFMLNGDPND